MLPAFKLWLTRLWNRRNRSWQGHVSAVAFAEMKLEFDAEAVRRFCQERGIARLELFGSALRDDFDSDSDVDLLASIRPGVKCGLFEWVDWQEGLARIFSRRVDLVSRRAVERSRNPYRKHSILSHTKPIHVEGQRLNSDKDCLKPRSSMAGSGSLDSDPKQGEASPESSLQNLCPSVFICGSLLQGYG